MTTPGRTLYTEGDTTPPAPAAGQILLYSKTNGIFYSLNSLGVESPIAGTVTSVGLADISTHPIYSVSNY